MPSTTTSSTVSTGTSSNKTNVEFYKLRVGLLPDELYRPEVPVEKWLEHCEVTTNAKEGFPPHSLCTVDALEWDVHLERLVGISLYMWMNVLPFFLMLLVLPVLLGVTCYHYFVDNDVTITTLFPRAKLMILVVLGYTAILVFLETMVFQPLFQRKYKQNIDKEGFLNSSSSDKDYRRNQYVFTERNTTKYMSTTFVWPKSMHLSNNNKDTPVLFCIVPHGVAPFGITAYPVWSKLWNSNLCRWTTAPVVLKIPIVGYLLSKIGYIPAKAPSILEALTKRDENVGIILDGIAGMFHQSATHETAYLKQRKGIVKIALKAGVPLVPVYGFGHTAAYTVLVDPFGILQRLSNALQTSLTPFLGRWGWLLGPPRRVPTTVCLGNPVICPKIDDPTQEQINQYHEQLLENYRQVFEQHKAAYGWKEKTLKFV